MTLELAASATVGALRYDTHVSEARVSLTVAPGVGSASITFPRDVRLEAAPGDEVALSLSGENGPEDLFAGKVMTVERSLDRAVVVAGDAAAELAKVRPGKTFERQGAAQIVRALAEMAGVETGAVDLDLDLAYYAADQGRTALEHVATLAWWAGAVATVDKDGKLQVKAWPAGSATVALRYGREIAELRVTRPRPAAQRTWVGSGPGPTVDAPGALLHTIATLPGGAAAPGPSSVRVPAPALRSPAAATGPSRAYADRNGAARVRATCWLVPHLRCGDVIELADTPDPSGKGPWILTAVEHHLGPGARGTTVLSGTALQSPGGGLLDDLFGAAAGLL